MTDIPTSKPARHKLDQLRYAAFASGALLLSILLVVVGLALWSATAGRLDSVKVSKDNAARSQCDAQYSQAASDAFRAYLADIGDLIVIISTSVPGADREASALDKVKDLSVQVEKSRQLAAARTSYLGADRPLPCPFPEAPTPNTTKAGN